MKRILISFTVVLLSVPAFAQCSFKAATNVKPRHDQYSQSSQANIDKSQKAMATTDNDFDKRKYQAIVKNPRGVAERRKTLMRFM
ncbi:MAG TPA: hypothetical protein VNZ45_03980 [Bacteroidia bacterium]|jgi:hypothetical protein|nr:hypothetical protein [Bacteroidia bacterium]